LTQADCAFCRILGGEVDAHVVLEDDDTLTRIDHRPLCPGHVLLMPREHVETQPDLPDELVAPLFSNARLLARAMKEGLGADGSFVAINNRVSQSVPHLHVHIVPRRWKDGLRGFFWPRHKYESEAQAAEVAARLRDAVDLLRS